MTLADQAMIAITLVSALGVAWVIDMRRTSFFDDLSDRIASFNNGPGVIDL